MTAPALSVYINAANQVSGDNFNTFEQTCDNMAQLRAFVGTSGLQIYVRGTTTPADGGQGAFYWNATGTKPDDNGVSTVVPSGAASGEWTRLLLAPWTPQIHQNGGGSNNGHNLMWADLNSDIQADHYILFSYDASQINSWTVGGSATAGDIVGFTWTVSGVAYNVRYTVKVADTLILVAAGIANAISTNTPLLNALLAYHTSDGIGYMPRAAAIGAIVVFDAPWAASGNSVIGFLSGGATETLTKNTTDQLDNGPYFNAGRYVAGRAPQINDELGAYFFASQSGASTNIDSTVGAVRAMVLSVSPLNVEVGIGGAVQTGTSPLNFSIALRFCKGIYGSKADGSGNATSTGDPGYGCLTIDKAIGIGIAPVISLDILASNGGNGQIRVRYDGAGLGLLVSQASSGGPLVINQQANNTLSLYANNSPMLTLTPASSATVLQAGIDSLPASGIATNAVTGFTYVPAGAGAPSGTPTNAGASLVPLYFDVTDHRLYFYESGAWHYVARDA